MTSTSRHMILLKNHNTHSKRNHEIQKQDHSTRFKKIQKHTHPVQSAARHPDPADRLVHEHGQRRLRAKWWGRRRRREEMRASWGWERERDAREREEGGVEAVGSGAVHRGVLARGGWWGGSRRGGTLAELKKIE
ncbi:hypothetical protein BRADI_5g07630v3 [Brachypodium distachyon]|uniref:Uncharacterized protein n=1 Tax=Brachypodium distachyon TaxID=15368 RepID=A0A2K2CFT2_BRADI|nr:hypothetical protein BRADI_5g07630v3 [Brachypodium distachyon]